MTRRFTAALLATALILGAFVMTQPSRAQGPASKGFFSSLKVGQMVLIAPVYQDQAETMTMPLLSIRTYDDPGAWKPYLKHKIVEITDSYLTAQMADSPNPGEITDMRIPAHSVMALYHVKKGGKKPGVK
ncbi:MAG: hypothetical protein EXS05_24380 [Planctomycetaceae bacterium]|nr:hypothetical protein [Planctomycetaceae bacterium]